MAERRAPPNGAEKRWPVVSTDAFKDWRQALHPERASQVTAALNRLAKGGPDLGRPRVDSIKGSRVHNLKELRLHDGVRMLFAFDPQRRAVMLVGGNKTGSWNRWYRRAIPAAERLYADHLRSMGKGERCLSPGTGRKPVGRSL